MRKTVLAIAAAASLLISSTVFAQNHRHSHRGGYSGNWIIPALIGGAIVYSATRPEVVYRDVAPAPVQVLPPPPPVEYYYEQPAYAPPPPPIQPIYEMQWIWDDYYRVWRQRTVRVR